MIGTMLRLAAKAAKEIPWWKTILITTASTAAVTAAGVAAQKAMEKLFADKSKSLDEKLADAMKLKKSGKLTTVEYKKLRKRLMNQSSTE